MLHGGGKQRGERVGGHGDPHRPALAGILELRLVDLEDDAVAFEACDAAAHGRVGGVRHEVAHVACAARHPYQNQHQPPHSPQTAPLAFRFVGVGTAVVAGGIGLISLRVGALAPGVTQEVVRPRVAVVGVVFFKSERCHLREGERAIHPKVRMPRSINIIVVAAMMVLATMAV